MKTSEHIDVDLFPGSMGLVGLCWECLGGDHVIGGEWMGPVTLKNVSQDDVDAIVELASEQGVVLTAKERIDLKIYEAGESKKCQL